MPINQENYKEFRDAVSKSIWSEETDKRKKLLNLIMSHKNGFYDEAKKFHKKNNLINKELKIKVDNLMSTFGEDNLVKNDDTKEEKELQQLVLNTRAKVLDLTKVKEPPLNEIGLPMTPLEAEVYEMVERGKKGLPPKYPYFHKEWDSVIDFIEEKYGKYLSSCNGGEEDALYIDYLGQIHPSTEEKTRIKKRISMLKNKELDISYHNINQLESKIVEMESSSYKNKYGEDVKQAIINYFRKKTTNYSSFIKPKQARTQKQLKQLLKYKAIPSHVKSSFKYRYFQKLLKKSKL